MSTIVVEFRDLGPLPFTLPDDDAARRVAYALVLSQDVMDVAMKTDSGDWLWPIADGWTHVTPEDAARYEAVLKSSQ